MINMLKNWEGSVEINNVLYNSIDDAIVHFNSHPDTIHIILRTKKTTSKTVQVEQISISKNTEYKIIVKPYMTKKSTADFDFMLKWNNDIPMPMRVMQGTVEKETRGMVYMKLHGLAKPTITCYCCGKELTNPISRHYGIGPICLGKLGIEREIDDVDNIREELANITWEGWVIRSAILSKEVIE